MLADKFTDSIIDHLKPFDYYKPYPTCSDRVAWNKIDEKFKKVYISRAEKKMSYEYQPLTAALIRYTGETDDLSNYYQLRRENSEALVSFVMAECIENKGRFMSRILDGVWNRLDEATWHYPCPTAMYKRFPTKIVDVTDPLIELGSSAYVYNLAIIYYLLKPKFDALSIDVFERLYHEIDRRIFTPYLDREDYWWMAFERHYHKKMGVLYSINNFTPHCVNNVVEAFLLLEQNDTRRAEAIQKTMKVLDNYLNYIADDGWCDEGNGYWFMSYGSLTLVLEKIKVATNGYVDIFNNKKIHEMGQFLCNAHIGNGYFVNFSDGHPINRLQNSKAISYALNTNNMGLLKMIFEISDSSAYEKLIIEKYIGLETSLFVIFNIEKIRNKFGTIGIESKYIVKEQFYSDSEVLIARESDNDYSGLYVACKGGHNDENHNHNDAGNFIVYKDSNPILIDPGVEAYIADTFNTNRYKLWTMQSAYHNLPTFNGVMQKETRQYKANNVQYSTNEDFCELSMELKNAYERHSGLLKYNRTVQLDRKCNRIICIDDIEMNSNTDDIEFSFMTPCQTDISQYSIDFIKDNEQIANMEYDGNMLSVSEEMIKFRCERLSKEWNNYLKRLILKVRKPGRKFKVKFIIS